MVLDPQLLAKVSKCVVVELLSIIGDQDPRNSKSVDYTFLDETSDVLSRDGC